MSVQSHFDTKDPSVFATYRRVATFAKPSAQLAGVGFAHLTKARRYETPSVYPVMALRNELDLEVRRRSAPSEFRRDVLEDALDRVRVVVDAERVRHGEKQCVGSGDRFVGREFFDEHVGLGGVRAAEDRARVAVDEADLILIARLAAEVRRGRDRRPARRCCG